MTRAALFDIDGTLVDTNDLHAAAWVAAFAKFGFDLPLPEVRQQIGKGGDNLVPSLIGEEKAAPIQEELESYRGDLFKRDYLPRAVPFAGVRELFERLQAQGAIIVLASSAKAEEVAFHLNLIGAADLVAATTSADDVESSKPDPDIFQSAVSKVPGLAVSNAVVIGDTPWDMKSARAAGIRGIGVLSGGFEEAQLRSSGASAIYRDPRHLAGHIPDWLAPA